MVKKQAKKKIVIFLFIFVIFCVLGIFIYNIPFSRVASFNSSNFLTKNELVTISSKNYFGPFVSVKIKNQTVDAISQNKIESYEPEIEFRLFNLIPIRNKKIKILKEDKVFVSGSAVGLVLKTDGVLVVGSSPILTLDGEKDVLDDNVLQIGDIIKEIEDEMVDEISSISRIVNEQKNLNKSLKVKILRNNREEILNVKPIYDVKSENYKLGLWVRDDASGIGTLTFIGENNRFGALGHPICDSDTKSKINLKEGKLYNCSIMGVNKGVSGKPGEIKGLFMQGKGSEGVLEKNNNYGVFGNIKENSSLFKNAKEYEIGGKISVKPGKAQIRCCIDGSKVETFDIEIIKTNYQNYSNDKSMVIRVIDNDLISRTGGIVQGMSGSPIIQNDKIVGAVTHVFVSDPTKGFGVYIDWMINQ